MRLLARIFAWLLLLAGAAPLLIYALGRMLTDRLGWSQFLYWIPGWFLLACAAAGLAPAWALSRVRPRSSAGEPSSRRASSRASLALLLSLALAALHECWEQRLYRALLPASVAGTAAGTELRLVHWTAMAPDAAPRDTTLPNLIVDYHADIVLLTMALAPHQYAGFVSRLPPEFDRLHAGIFVAASRLPIRSSRMFSLGLSQNTFDHRRDPNPDPTIPAPVPDEPHHWLEYLYNRARGPLSLPERFFRDADPGTLLVLTLDGSARFGRDLTIYFYDLPSDPIRPKAEIASHISTLVGRLIAAGDLAPPDLILGDFNIPRGSASLDTIARGFTSAYVDAGLGPCSTWPRTHPVLHLDQLFHSSAWRASAYHVFDPGRGDHFGQTATLEFLEHPATPAPPAMPASASGAVVPR